MITKQVTKEEALNYAEQLFGLDGEDYYAEKVKQYIEQDTQDKTEIKELRTECRVLGKDLIIEIEQKKQYREENAELKKQIEQLRSDLSHMSNKLDSNDIPL